MKTIRDLLKEHNIEADAPDYVLDYEIGEDDEYFGEYHEETDEDGNTIHVFVTEGYIEGTDVKMITECILDLNKTPRWGMFQKADFESVASYNGVSFDEEGNITYYDS